MCIAGNLAVVALINGKLLAPSHFSGKLADLVK